jgi:probable phosphoglycerate mutase
MVEIYIARHGQDEDNLNGILNGHRNTPLSMKGVDQAYDLAIAIKKSKLTFDAVYASPLLRANRTAEIICEELGLEEPEVLDLLIERDFGNLMTGKPVNKIEELCAPDVVKTDKVIYFLSPEGAETFPALLERGRRILNRVYDKHNKGKILLVTHGDIGKMIYANYYGLGWMEMLTKFHFGNCELLLLSQDSSAEESHIFKFEQFNH